MRTVKLAQTSTHTASRPVYHKAMIWLICLFMTYLVYVVWDWLHRRQQVEKITKKCVFITGCDRGFGHSLALRLDSLGVPVFAGCLTEQGEEALKAETSERLHTVRLDVTSVGSVEQALQYVKSNLPDGTVLWGIVNNAGILGPGGPVEFVPRQEYVDTIAVNFLGVTEVTRTFLPLIKAARGRIVNTSSVAGFFPVVGYYAYLASKYAVNGYTEALRLEKKEWGIGVSSIFPGSFGTGMMEDRFKKKVMTWEGLPQTVRDEYGADYMEKYAQLHQQLAKWVARADFNPVVDAYQHALFSRKPRARYYPGYDAKLMAFVNSLPMPAFLEDLLFSLFQPPTPRPKILT